ncbi:MAG: arylesterase [Ahrensia sp.]
MVRFVMLSGLIGLAATVATKAETLTGVGFGDSLMAGYQLPKGDGFTDQLQAALQEAGYDVTIANAGVSGDTSSGGRERLDWSVPDDADFVILELGANDALRGISPDITRANLTAMIERFDERGIDVILVGILAPPNMGSDYGAAFNPIYADLAEQFDVPLYDFFLDGVITEPALMLDDGIHPNAEGVAEMVRRFMPLITGYLDSRQN